MTDPRETPSFIAEIDRKRPLRRDGLIPDNRAVTLTLFATTLMICGVLVLRSAKTPVVPAAPMIVPWSSALTGATWCLLLFGVSLTIWHASWAVYHWKEYVRERSDAQQIWRAYRVDGPTAEHPWPPLVSREQTDDRLSHEHSESSSSSRRVHP